MTNIIAIFKKRDALIEAADSHYKKLESYFLNNAQLASKAILPIPSDSNNKILAKVYSQFVGAHAKYYAPEWCELFIKFFTHEFCHDDEFEIKQQQNSNGKFIIISKDFLNDLRGFCKTLLEYYQMLKSFNQSSKAVSESFDLLLIIYADALIEHAFTPEIFQKIYDELISQSDFYHDFELKLNLEKLFELDAAFGEIFFEDRFGLVLSSPQAKEVVKKLAPSQEMLASLKHFLEKYLPIDFVNIFRDIFNEQYLLKILPTEINQVEGKWPIQSFWPQAQRKHQQRFTAVLKDISQRLITENGFPITTYKAPSPSNK